MRFVQFTLMLILFGIWTVKNEGANILYISPVGSPSHHIWNYALVQNLVEKGHKLTYISPDSKPFKRPNFTSILIEGLYEDLQNEYNYNDMGDMHPFTMIHIYLEWSQLCCRKLYESINFQNYLIDTNQDDIDLLILDVTTGSCLMPLIEYFKWPPTLAVTAFILPSYLSINFGNHLYSSYVPWYDIDYTSKMAFFQRFQNLIYICADVLARNYYHNPKEVEQIAKSHLPNIKSDWKQLENHISLLLANTDPILNNIQPLPPNIIPVGGLHIKPAQKLNKDLEEIFERAKTVIFFSLGTNVKSDRIPSERIEHILNAFSQLPKTTIVIWKFESTYDKTKMMPSNVVMQKWLPQNDILAHPKTKLFISHCGALSLHEAIYNGVPILALPFVVDQFHNAKYIVNHGLGLEMSYERITSDYLLGKIQQILNNADFMKNMKLVSDRYRDKPLKPMDLATFWIEYSLRHNGTAFLNNPARFMPFYVANSLDCLGFILLVILIMYKICLRFRKVNNTDSNNYKIGSGGKKTN